MKSCDNCILKSDRKTSKYKKHGIYCTKRQCTIPSQEEAIWCKFYKENDKIIKIN